MNMERQYKTQPKDVEDKIVPALVKDDYKEDVVVAYAGHQYRDVVVLLYTYKRY